MANPGIIVVNSGDVETALPDEKSYSSEFQSPKVTLPFSGSMALDANGYGRVSVYHGLPYSPVAFAFYKINDGNWYPTNNTTVGCETNVADFVIRTYGQGTIVGGATLYYKAWLMLDPAQEIL